MYACECVCVHITCRLSFCKCIWIDKTSSHLLSLGFACSITRTCIGCTTCFFWHLHNRTGTKHSLVELAHEGEDISKRHVGSTLSGIGCVFPVRPYIQQLMTRLKIALQSRPRFLQEGTHIPTFASMYTNIQSSGKQNN